MPYTIATIQVSDKGGKATRQFSLANQQGVGSVTFDCSIAAAGAHSYTISIDGQVYDTEALLF